ncbi:MAG: hypothetical protein IPO04_17210 [Cytophagaceae bacterium]|nr:hypothetical protein [Cytophagaceae bacterium]
MIGIKHKLLVGILIFLTISTSGQLPPYRVNHFGTKEGLSQGSIYAILKDSRGYMWFGSQDGLNIFDGKKISIYKPDPDQKRSVSGLKISGILEDSNADVWVGHENGLSRYDFEKDQFTNFFPGEEVLPIAFKFGKLWLMSSRKGYISLDVNNLKYSSFYKKIKYTPNFTSNFNSIEIISPTEYWIAENHGLVHFKNGKSTNYFSENKNNVFGKHLNIIKIKLFDEKLYLGTAEGLIIFDPKLLNYKKIDKFNGQNFGLVQSLDFDSKGKLWMGTEFLGLVIYNSKTGKMDNIKRNSEFKAGIKDNLVSHLYIDNNDIVWANSDPYGIDKIDILPGNFAKKSIDFPINFPSELKNNSIRAVCEDGNNLWLATLNSGLWLLNRNDLSFKKYFITSNSKLPSNHLSHLLKTQDGKIFVATSNGLAQIVNETVKDIPIKKYFQNNEDAFIRSLDYTDKTLIMSTEKGILRYNTQNGQISWDESFREERVIFTYSVSPAERLISTIDKGLFLQKNNSSFHLLKNVIPVFVKQDIRKNFWVGTSNGLFYLNKSGKIIKKYGQKEGMPNEFVYCGEFSDPNNLWLSTNRGICKLNIQDEKFVTFNLNDGLQDYEYNSFASLASNDGRLYFGGVDGLNYFYPGQIISEAQIEYNQLTNNAKELIPIHFQAFLDGDRQYKRPEINNPAFESKLKEVSGAIPNFLYTDAQAWVKFKIKNNSNQTWFLEVENTRLSELEVWIFEKDQEVFYGKSGDQWPFKRYKIKDPNPIFELNLLENQQYDVYIRAATTRDLKIPVRILNESEITAHISNRKLVWGIFSGFIILISFYNLFLFFTIRDRTYLYYMIYILSLGLFQFSIYGLSFQYFWQNHPFNEYAFLMFLYVSYIFITLFTEKFLELEKEIKFWKPIKYFILTFSIILLIVTPFWHPNQINYFAIALSMIFSFLYYLVCIIYIKRRIAIIYFYAFAVFFLTTASLIIALQNLGVLSSLYQEYVLMIGSMFEIVLFSLALGYKFRRNQLERERQQRLRNQISGNLHDDLAASLSSLTMYSELSKRKTGSEAEIKERLQTIADKARDILGRVRLAVYELNPKNDNEENWLERILDFGKEICEARNIDFFVEIEDNFNPDNLHFEKRRELIYLFKEALNNAAKYSDAERITLKMWQERNRKIIELSDNGKGFILDDPRGGNGLINMRARAEKINAEYKISSAINMGTTIKIKI